MADRPLPRLACGLLPRFLARLGAAIPSPSAVIFGSAAWGALMAIAAIIGIWWRDGMIVISRFAVISLFFYGPAVGFAPGLWLSELLCGKSGRTARLFVGTIVLTLSTHTATAAIFALQYRMFYAHWHAHFPSVVWGFQFAFTTASALYQFTVDSLYIYFPAAPLLFIALGVWFSRRAH
jgi:hypothetical protein